MYTLTEVSFYTTYTICNIAMLQFTLILNAFAIFTSRKFGAIFAIKPKHRMGLIVERWRFYNHDILDIDNLHGEKVKRSRHAV